MSNSYYTPPTDIAALTRARSGDINVRDDAVDAAFDKVPDEAKLKRGTVNYAVTAGAADAYTVTLPYVPSGYVDGLLVNAYIHATNTGASTVNVNSLGVKSIKRQNGDTLLAGDLLKFVDIRYSTTTGFFHVQGSTATSVQSAADSAAASAASAAASNSSASSSSSSANASAASAAAALASLNDFKGRWYGPLSSDPSLDPLGAAISVGDAYFNTASNLLKIYNGSTWQASDINTANLAASSGAGLIGWIRNAINAIATTLAKWMGWQHQSVFEFMTDAQVTAAYAMSTTQDLAPAINNAFSAGNKTIRLVGPARYTIGSPLYLTSGLTVLCDDNAEIYLKDNARCFMIRTVTTGLTNIKWLGGIINGNDANQGDQAADGANFDISKGFYLVNVAGVEVGNVTVKETRGHGFNHWNCSNFHFHDMVFDQTIDTIQPVGGKRRDGVTGSSSNGLIENISGYTNDDMVALASGVDWAGTGTVPQTVNNVTIRNIRPGMKSGQRTWRGARVVSLNGYLIDNITVDDVKGETALASIEVGSYDPYTTGSVGQLKISNIGGPTPFTSTFGAKIPVVFYNTTIDSLSIDNAAYTLDDNSGTISALINIDKCTIQTAQLSNITGIDKRTTDNTLSAIFVRNDSVVELEISNASISSTIFPTSTLKLIVQRTQSGGSGAGVVNLRGSNWNIGQRTGETKQTVSVSSGLLTPWSIACVFSLADANPIIGCTMTDFNCGQVNYDGGRWNQVTIPYRVAPPPTTGNWKSGFMFYEIGSPRSARLGYLNIDGTAPFSWQAMSSNIVMDGVSGDFSAALSTYAEDVITTLEIGATQSASFPGGLPGILTTYRSSSSDTFAFQEYRVRQSNTIYARYWTGAAWTAFVQTTVV